MKQGTAFVATNLLSHLRHGSEANVYFVLLDSEYTRFATTRYGIPQITTKPDWWWEFYIKHTPYLAHTG